MVLITFQLSEVLERFVRSSGKDLLFYFYSCGGNETDLTNFYLYSLYFCFVDSQEASLHGINKPDWFDVQKKLAGLIL